MVGAQRDLLLALDFRVEGITKIAALLPTALGAQRKEVLHTALARPLKLLAFGSVAGLLLGVLASRVIAFIVAQATPRDPLVLGGGPTRATWIRAEPVAVSPLKIALSVCSPDWMVALRFSSAVLAASCWCLR